MLPVPETHEEYARRIGAPRVVDCDVDIAGSGLYVFVCRTHDYRYNDRGVMVGRGLNDRCPVSRLEEWRARRWRMAEAIEEFDWVTWMMGLGRRPTAAP